MKQLIVEIDESTEAKILTTTRSTDLSAEQGLKYIIRVAIMRLED